MALRKFGRGKYSKNLSLIDFQELQLKNVIDFCFITLNKYFLKTFEKRVRVFLGTK